MNVKQGLPGELNSIGARYKDDTPESLDNYFELALILKKK